MHPKTPLLFAISLGALFLTGCGTRSISNSDYDAAYGSGRYGKVAGNYAGELSELDVIGASLDAGTSETEIQNALRDHAPARLGRTSKVLLIQSGADFPDSPMLEALSARFAVAGFSGKPVRGSATGPDYARALRLVAARGGYDKIVYYWGVLESERKNKITSVVSWVPIVGQVIPDEREHMRIRLKAVIVDVASGKWALLAPPPSSDSSLSTVVSRRSVDQDLVHGLKAQGYRDLSRLLAEQYTE
ncbi:MAG: hypothetical protein JNK23_20490 [Opitutaceae bacterium]|nr:hypothetical protein [Opitutaceae bacterium]